MTGCANRGNAPMATGAMPWFPVAGSVLAGVLWVPQAALIAWAIGGIATNAPLSQTLAAALALVLIGAARAGLEALASAAAFRHARLVLSRERAAALARLAGTSPLDISRPASGLAASIIAEQAEAIVPYLAKFGPARARATIEPLVILAVVLPISWLAAGLLIMAAPVIPLFMALIGWRARAASSRQLQAAGDINAFLLDRLRGLAAIRALSAVEVTAARLTRESQGLRSRTMAVLRIAFLSSAALELFAALGVALSAGYIGLHLLGQIGFGVWGAPLSLAEGMFILLLAPALFEPLRSLAAVWHDRAAGQAALEAIRALSASTARLPEETPVARPVALPRIWRAISDAPPALRLRNVGFCHAGATVPVLSGFDLDIAAGARVALFCRSGGGKTTVLSLIAALAVPSAGEIMIGGVALSPQTAARLRARIAWIGQKPHFFAGSLRTNLTLGRAASDPAAFARAADMAALTGFGAGDRQLGEDGSGLSGGEALRLALGRAAFDPARDLILADEPTAHLDRLTAGRISDGLLELAVGRTLIVATHDPVLAARMDVVVEPGLTGWRVAS